MRLAGGVFGMTVQVAASQAEFDRYVLAARKAGGVEVGEATRTDYDIVIDEKIGVVLVNPTGAQAIVERLCAAAIAQENP